MGGSGLEMTTVCRPWNLNKLALETLSGPNEADQIRWLSRCPREVWTLENTAGQ